MKASVVLLTAGFLVLGVCDTARAQRNPEPKAPSLQNQPQPEYRPIASGRQRNFRERERIAILQGRQDVAFDRFTELVIAKMTDVTLGPKDLTGMWVSLSRDVKVPSRWNIFQGGGADGETLVLPENVLRIQGVVPSTDKDPVKVQIDGRVYHLEPGEVLLLLG